MRARFLRRTPSVARCLRCRWNANQERQLSSDAFLVKSAVVRLSKKAQLNSCRRGHITWEEDKPKNALLVKKRHSADASDVLKRMGEWLQRRDMHVYVEKIVKEKEFPDFLAFDPDDMDIDLCVTLGGDGTVLHLASLMEEDLPMPPVVSFAMGTVGFLTPFDVPRFERHLTRILQDFDNDVECTLRSRKKCEVITATGRITTVHHVLNECIVDRGASQSTITVEIFVDGVFVATVTADGLIVATPSGSTAYSMTAGGPMVAPSVPCTIITPVAPLSLSFRPVVIPESSEIVLHVAKDSKSIARASFDGRKQARLPRQSALRLTASKYPLPLINIGQYDADWYEGITQKLKWNQSIGDPSTTPKRNVTPSNPFFHKNPEE